MKYIINGHGQLKIQNYTKDKIQIVIENKTREWFIKDIKKLISQTDTELKVRYTDKESAERIASFKPKGSSKSLTNIMFTECVGCGNTDIKKLT